jgi:FkbM family methyltransferase
MSGGKTTTSWRVLARRLVPRRIRNSLRSPRITASWFYRELAYRLGYRPVYRVRDDWQVRYHPTSVASFRAIDQQEDIRQELEAFVAHCAPGMVLLDIGAHYGVFTLAALHYGGPEARVIAVDPSSETSRVLRINLQLVRASTRVQVVEAALGGSDGERAMLTTGPFGDHFMIAAEAPRSDTTLVPQYTIASLLAGTGLVPTHIKIDVEGLEGEVLQGGRDFLHEHGPILFLELHCTILRSRGQNPADVLELLAGCGYTRFTWHGRPISQDEILALDTARIVCLK